MEGLVILIILIFVGGFIAIIYGISFIADLFALNKKLYGNDKSNVIDKSNKTFTRNDKYINKKTYSKEIKKENLDMIDKKSQINMFGLFFTSNLAASILSGFFYILGSPLGDIALWTGFFVIYFVVVISIVSSEDLSSLGDKEARKNFIITFSLLNSSVVTIILFIISKL